MEPDPISAVIFAFSVLTVVFAVVAELALSTLNRYDIRTLRAQGIRNAVIVDGLLRDRVQLLATTMLLKTAGLVAAGGAIVRIIPGGDDLLQYGVAIIGTWIMLALVQVVARGLVLPHAERTALALARAVQAAYVLLWPVAALVRQVGQQVGSDEKEDAEESVFMSDESLRLLMDVDDDQEPILDSEKEMIESILEMDETVVREVMVPRIDIVSLGVGATLREALDTVIQAGHSRIPVYEENIDHIVGFLYAKDLLTCFLDNAPDAPIRELLRPAHFVPASKKLNALLREMQKHRVHIMMVVDEYGGTAGLVTIEDILEEIVGEIEDEYDEVEEPEVAAIGPNAYQLSARFDVYSLSKLLNIDLPDEDSDTLGGVLYGQFGHVPEPGESVVIGGWRFTVLSLDGRGIDLVRAESVEGEALAAENAVDAQAGVEAGDDAAEGRGSVLNYSVGE